jgi:hypothetical protein
MIIITITLCCTGAGASIISNTVLNAAIQYFSNIWDTTILIYDKYIYIYIINMKNKVVLKKLEKIKEKGI